MRELNRSRLTYRYKPRGAYFTQRWRLPLLDLLVGVNWSRSLLPRWPLELGLTSRRTQSACVVQIRQLFNSNPGSDKFSLHSYCNEHWTKQRINFFVFFRLLAMPFYALHSVCHQTMKQSILKQFRSLAIIHLQKKSSVWRIKWYLNYCIQSSRELQIHIILLHNSQQTKQNRVE